MKNEARFRMVELRDPARYEQLLRAAEDHVRRRHSIYEQLAGLRVTVQASEPPRGTG
jgi:pyruvate-ferredoxin/flavodoxin oxidoreductase